MMESLPEKVAQKWIVAPDGAVTRWEPPVKKAVKKRTSGQQHAALRIAMAQAFTVLTKNGFTDGNVEPSSVACVLAYGGITFDLTIKSPARIAYVTSVPSDTRERKIIARDIAGNPVYEAGPGVKLASDVLSSPYVIQVIGSRIGSGNPVYIDLPPDEPEPVKYALKNILMLVASVIQSQDIVDKANLAALEDVPAWLKADVEEAVKLLGPG